MQINLESSEQNTIQSYSDNTIQINSIIYTNSVLVSREEIISDLTIKNIEELDDEFIKRCMPLKPEIIIVGHNHPGKFPSPTIMSDLSKQRIALECMTIGAACRTFNVLLSEARAVIVVLII